MITEKTKGESLLFLSGLVIIHTLLLVWKAEYSYFLSDVTFFRTTQSLYMLELIRKVEIEKTENEVKRKEDGRKRKKGGVSLEIRKGKNYKV